MSRLRPTFVLSALLLIIVPIWCGGCAQFDPRRGIPWRQDEEIENSEAPDKLIAVWNDTVLYQPNKPPVRGFGGRVFFYGNEEDQPIRVDGTMVVYGFDEDGRSKGDAAPDKKFVFPAEVLSKHETETKIGAAYDFWLPWDQAGGNLKKISLIVRFKPTTGPVVISEQVTQVLPGPPKAEERKVAPPSGEMLAQRWAVKSASYTMPIATSPAHSQTVQSERMTTTTIPLPGKAGPRAPQATVRPRTAGRPLTQWQRQTVAAASRPIMASAQPVSAISSPVSSQERARPSIRSALGKPRPLASPTGLQPRDRSSWRHAPEAPRSGP